MNKLVVALLAGGFACGSAVARGEDGVPVAPDQTPRQPPSIKEKRKAVEQAIQGEAKGPAKPAGAVGDFPPYRGRTVDQWRQDEKRRQERLEQTTPKSTTLKSTDEERAERKRLVDEWEKSQQALPK